MCKETIQVLGLSDQRTAYEVEEYLQGVPAVEQAKADFLNDEIAIQYNEDELDHDAILTYIEHSGCKPEDRISGVIDHIRAKLSMM